MPVLTITPPELHTGQIDIYRNPARFLVVAAGRRFGKSMLASVLCLRCAVRGGRAWWVFPTYVMARIGWRAIKRLVVQIPDAEVREGDKIVTLPGGGTIEVRSADNPDSLRGGAPIARRQYSDEWDSDRPSQETLAQLITFSEAAIIFGGNFFADILPRSTHWIVWDKQNTMPSFGDCELAWTNLDRHSVKKYSIVYNGLIGKEKERYHPTQKPVTLMAEILKDYTVDNAVILDPFLGSGTTLIACEQLGRRCRAVEISPAYVAVALERWATATGKTPVLIQGE